MFAQAALPPQRFVDSVCKGLPLEDWSCLKTGIAGVLGERSGREARRAGGSLRNWCQSKAARRILPNTGVGCVQGKGRGHAGRAGRTPLWLGENNQWFYKIKIFNSFLI